MSATSLRAKLRRIRWFFKRECEVPFIGSMTRRWGIWESQRKFSLFGADVSVLIERIEPPSERQVALLEELIRREQELHAKVQHEVFQLYSEDDQRELLLTGPPEELAPQFNHPEEMWKLIELTEIFIPKDDTRDFDISIGFSCTWEEEHALVVRLRDWGIVDSNFE